MTSVPRSSPLEYRLDLDVDYRGLTFSGRVGFVSEPGASTAELDLDGLAIRSVSRNGAQVPYSVAPAGDRLRLDLPDRAGGRIEVEFDGRVSTGTLSGLYRSRHGDGYLLTAQCEPTGARAIFPCFDRPDRKGRVVLSVTTDPDLEVIANAPVESVRPVGGRSRWTFGPTPPMATYLFYLAIGRFDRSESRSRRAAIRVLTPPGRADAGRFAAATAARVLDAFEEYYALPYPLPKLDLIAVEELDFGAMENWGAISFQANRLLVSDASGTFAKRDVLETTSHEIAHQWFGNLVTMAWWTDIWLNESFASLMETKIAERLEPTLDARADFFLRVAGMAAALDGDSLASTHPVRCAVEQPSEIGQIFDEISYGKGSSVLGMLDAYLGEDRFRAGVTDYLKRYAHGNAETADLWRSLERASGEPVAEIAGPWIDRPGLPVIDARISSHGLELTQRRFRYLGSEAAAPWPIPLIADIDGERRRLRFDTERLVVPVDPGATVHLNPGAVGFYRVHYDRALADRLLAALPTRPAPDRWTYLEDLAAFLLSGEAGWVEYERAVRTLGGTDDRLVVESITGALAELALMFPDFAPVRDTAQAFFATQTERLGPARRPEERPTDGILRERTAFGRARIDAEYARRLGDRFADWHVLDPDLRLATAVGFARSGGASGYRTLRSALQDAAAEADRTRLARSLGWGSEPALLRETLDFALSGGINRSYLRSLIVQASANPAGRSVVWPWFSERVDDVAAAFRGSGGLPLVLELAVPAMAVGRVEEVRDFLRSHPMPEGSRGAAKALEWIELHTRLAARLMGPDSGPVARA